MKFEHIVCPVDFSKISMNAYRFAAELAHQSGNAAIHLVHIYDKPYYQVASDAGTLSYKVDPERQKEILEEINTEFHKLADVDFVKDLKVYKRLVSDIAPWKFYEDLDKNKADVIVMGTSGHSGLLKGKLFGSNAERIIRHSELPVITLHETREIQHINRVLFATDFKAKIENIFDDIVDTVNLLKAELLVGMINTRDNFSTTEFANAEFEHLRGKHPKAPMSLVIENFDNVPEGIGKIVDKHDVDMIIMLTEGRTGLVRLFNDSIAEDMATSPFIHVPVMTIRTANTHD